MADVRPLIRPSGDAGNSAVDDILLVGGLTTSGAKSNINITTTAGDSDILIQSGRHLSLVAADGDNLNIGASGATGSVVDISAGSTENITFNALASGDVPFNEAGQLTPSTTATSVIGSINEINSAVSSHSLQDAYDAGTGTIALDATGDLVIELDSATAGNIFSVDSSNGGADYFRLTASGADTMGLNAVLASASYNISSSNFTIDVGGSGILDVDAAGGISLEASNSGNIGIGTNTASPQTINLGTGGSAKTLGIGNTTSTSSTTVRAGTGGINLDTTGNAVIDADLDCFIRPVGAIDINANTDSYLRITGEDAGSSLDLNVYSQNGLAGGASLSLQAYSNGAQGVVNVGTSDPFTGSIAVTVGATTTTSATTIQAGTGNIILTSHGSTTNFNEAGANAALVGFTEDNVIGALNELKAAGGGGWSDASNTDVDIGTETVDSFTPGADGSVVWHYYIGNVTNHRAGTVTAAWDDSENLIVSDEASTSDLGDTSNLTLNVIMSAGLISLQATAVTTNNWIVRVIRSTTI